MIKRLVILKESDAKKLDILNPVLEPISFSYLHEINKNINFALSYLKDKRLDEILKKYFKFYLISMIDFYEYKELDQIITLRLDNQKNIQLFLLKINDPKPVKIMIDELN